MILFLQPQKPLAQTQTEYLHCEAKCFKDENKLQQHKDKMHDKFECDECDKLWFNLENNEEEAHENVELVCHYFNN